jgi:hypothetical protein
VLLPGVGQCSVVGFGDRLSAQPSVVVDSAA